VNAVTVRQAVALARRSIIGTARQPEAVFPSIFFPMFFAALSTASFERSTGLPGFPEVDSFLDFLLAATVVQGVLFGSTAGGNDMAVDIQDGFFDRLMASPVPRPVILVGRLAGTGVLGAVQAGAFMAVLTLFGASVKGGWAAVLAIVVVSTVLAVGVGGFAVALALRTGSSEAVQASFPVFFIVLFVSSAFFPRELMSGWFRTAAGVNPLSWMIEALRRLTIERFSAGDAVEALAVVVGLAVVSITLAGLALRARVAAR
jgi:ABC-2 type transport system permease protein